jgi:alkylated DNA repair dioxygenase AlkB
LYLRQGDVGYGIRLPHNSLLVMWPPCQEEWKHEVRDDMHH